MNSPENDESSREKTEAATRRRERLRNWLGDQNLSQADFARRIGKDDQYVSEMVNSHIYLSPEIAEKLANLRLDLHWLSTGEPCPSKTATRETLPTYSTGLLSDRDLLIQIGERLSARVNPDPHVVFADDPRARAEIETGDYVAVPLMADCAAAGRGNVMEDEIKGYVLIHRHVAPRPENIRCFRLEGDSMVPTLTPGSILAIDVSRRDPARAEGRVVCVRIPPDEAIVKRWRAGPRHVVLDSDNPAHPPIVLEPDDIPDAIIGTVIWAWLDLSHL